MACHWPEYFFSAMLNAFVEQADKFKGYLAQAVSRGIKLLPPDINRSDRGFTVDREAGGIRFGLCGLTGLNKLADRIVSEREDNGLFTDIEDFYTRLANTDNKPSSAHLASLVNSGAFDTFGLNRRSAQVLCDRVALGYKSEQKDMVSGQISMFELGMTNQKIELPQLDEYDDTQYLNNEFKALGVYLSGHPANKMCETVKDSFDGKVCCVTGLVSSEDGTYALCIGQVKNLAKRLTKKNEIMLKFELQDQFQSVKVVIFPKQAKAAEPFLIEGQIVGVNGKFTKDESFGNQFVGNNVYTAEQMLSAKPEVLVVTVCNKGDQEDLKKLVSLYPGTTRVSLRAKDRDRVYPTKWRVNAKRLDFIDRLSCRWEYRFS